MANRNPFRFKGYYYDDESGMYYCHTRYYVPEWGRWLNCDNPGFLQFDNINGMNLFAYCGNNPVMYADPSGHLLVSAILIMLTGAFVGAAISAGSSIITQAAFNDGEINWQSVLIATISGAINGALSASPLGVGALMVAGGILGAATYIADCAVTNQEVSFIGIASSIGFGVLSAKIGGNGANYKFGLSKSISQVRQQISKEMKRANTRYAQKVILRVTKDLHNDLFDTISTSSVRFYFGTRLGMIAGEIFD